MRPSRMVVGEVRAEECLDLLLALNSGLPGMATVHENSAREALVKLCTLPLLAGAKQGRRERARTRSPSPLLPDSAPRRGGLWSEHLRVVEAICWRFRTGSPWRDLLRDRHHAGRLCCVARAGGMVERSHVGESDGERQLIEHRR